MPGYTFETFSRDGTDQAVVGANGSAFVDIGVNPPVAGGQVWEVQMVTGATNLYSTSSITLLKDGALPVGSYPLQYNNFTANPVYQASASAVGPPYVYLQKSETLRVKLTGGKVGDTFTVWWLFRKGVTY